MASSGPAAKRQRLSPSDPSIPIPNCSPFLDSRNDVINDIFCRIASQEKRKMGLELVCEMFRTRLADRACWKLDRDVTLNFGDGVFKINGIEFNAEQAPKAIGTLLERVRVESIIFERFGDDVSDSVMWDIASEIRAHIDSFQLKTIKYDKVDPTHDGLAILTNVLVSSDLSKLRIIYATFNKNLLPTTTPFTLAFWTIVQGCRESLTRFTFGGQMSNDQNLKCCLKLLKGCPALASLGLFISPQAAVDGILEQLAVLCNSLNRLKNLVISGIDHSEFVQLLNQPTKSHIIRYVVATLSTSPEHDAVDIFLRSAVDHFPNLQELFSDVTIDAETYLAIIDNVLANFGNRRPYKFTLKISVDEASRYGILHKIATEKSAKIAIDNGVCSCLKNELNIVMKF